MKIFHSLLLVGATVVAALDTYSAKILVDTNTFECELIDSVHVAQLHRSVEHPDSFIELTTKRKSRLNDLDLLRNSEEGTQEFVEIIGGSVDAVLGQLAKRCPSGALRHNAVRSAKTFAETTVIKKIVDSGPPKNRIDIVFMGDGYQASEEALFFKDIQRLTDDLFTGDTFTQYLPLFNVWAVHVPSVESGIGVGSKPRNTAFQLYRRGTELRGVYPNKPQYAREVCKTVGEFACDFPSLVGNDAFYGGLRGEFVVVTSSVTSGSVVLRHEFGHSFGKVGEEYDGGKLYVGANTARSINEAPWKHWLTNPDVIREEKAVQRFQKHIWHDLQQGSYQIKFTSNGAFKRWKIVLSVSGADTNDALSITLNGEPLPWTTKGIKDRSFYSWRSSDAGFPAGDHVLNITAGGSFDSPIIKQLCSALIYEYAGEDEFKLDDNDHIGFYPTWDINKRLLYRPDNEKCLMRNMTSPQFCTPCQENLWLQFLTRISFIEDLVVTGKDVALKLIPLGQLRPNPIPNERYSVQWFNNGHEVKTFRDQFSIDVSTVSGATKQWTVKVNFTTPTIRVDSKGVTRAERSFNADYTTPTSTLTPTTTAATPTTTKATPSPTTATPVPTTVPPAPIMVTLTPTTIKAQYAYVELL
ncbi:hypothetical protein DYB28_001497 [Aphanomyces astaci]|uniref:IgA peptidase M64-domain-containing protein n=1 Tax=Aphanomyces astaci TaxID=112090 RepID=A0A9X8EE81_APHAT|nr:hypothetical protein DYB28_001497 [Aphanomyces astaci]